MTLDEAQKVADIIATADGGCSVCVGNLIERFERAFPNFTMAVTGDDLIEQPDWSDEPEDAQCVGKRIDVIVKGHRE